MTSIVVGASGFLGERLTEVLVESGEPVRALVRPNSDVTRLKRLAVEVVRTTFDDMSELTGALAGARHVYNCAGMSSDWGRWRDFELANVALVQHLLDSAYAVGCVEKLIHVSTSDVYGYPKRACAESHGVRDCGLPYNRSKGRGDRSVIRSHAQTGLHTVVVRPASIFGPRSKDFVIEICRMLSRGEMLTVGAGMARAGLIYVDDAVQALILLAHSPAVIGKAYNLRDPLGLTWREYLDRLSDGLGLPRVRLNAPEPLALAIAGSLEAAHGLLRIRSRPMLTRHAVYLLSRDQGYDISAIERDAGFKPEVGVLEGIERTLRWLRSAEGRRAVPLPTEARA
jgi:nucleoside-diphosphate-sugar epimerase